MATDREKFYLREFLRGRIGRREFVGRMAAAGFAAAAIPGLLAKQAVAETPKRGGKVVVGAYANPKDSFEPVRFLSLSAISAGMTAYDTLVGRDAQLHPTPWLAKSWDFNSDATEWVFKLREDVVFHDGKKFGADDVIYTYSRIIGPESTSPLKVVFEHVAEIKKDDDHTVRFVLNSPDVDFPVSCGDHRSVVLRDGYTDFRKTTIGTGPFKVKSYEPGVRYHFVRNDDYWGDDGPWVDEIEFLGIQDATTRFNALLSGDIDVVGGLDPKGQDLIERRDDLEIITAKSTTPVSLTMMLDREPTNDPNLRLALKYAVDRERIVDVVFKGLAHIGNDHTISPILPFHCADIPQRPYDPEKARFYIKKAGLENVPIDIHTSDVLPGMVAATEVFQETASAAGIKVNVIRVPADTFWDTAWMVKPLYVAYWDARPTINIMFSTVFASDAPWNESAWRNERFDQLLLEARGTIHEGKRQEMYCEMQRMLQDEGGHSTWVHTDYTDARHSHVKGITPHPSGSLGFFKFARTVWLDT